MPSPAAPFTRYRPNSTGWILSYASGLAVLREQPVRPIHAGGFHGRGQPGELPVVYVRGNHELLGEEAERLQAYIPTPNGEFYYTLAYNNAYFLINDLAFNKADAYPGFSGLSDGGELPDAPNGLRRAGRLGGRGGGSSVFRASFAYPHLHGNGSSQAKPKKGSSIFSTTRRMSASAVIRTISGLKAHRCGSISPLYSRGQPGCRSQPLSRRRFHPVRRPYHRGKNRCIRQYTGKDPFVLIVFRTPFRISVLSLGTHSSGNRI